MTYALLKAEIVGMAIYGPLSPAQMFWLRWTSKEWHQQTAAYLPAREFGRLVTVAVKTLARKQAFADGR